MYILFDLDRTLWDFDTNALITFRQIYNEFGLEAQCHVPMEVFHEYYVAVNAQLWDAYRGGTLEKEMLSLQRFALPLEHFGVQTPMVLAERMADYYVHEGVKQTTLMPGAREVLQHFAQSPHVLCIITNGFSEAQLPKMRTAGIDQYFQHFFLSEELGYMKPDRRFFEAVLSHLGTTADDCVVIGDDYDVDIVGASRAGIRQVYYNYHHKSLADKPAPTCTITHLHELLHLPLLHA